MLGASGAVGLIGVQAAKLLGAGQVIAAARNAVGLDRARALGADAVVQLEAVDDLAGAFRQVAGDGFDVILDPLWGEPAAAAIAAANVNARLVQLGQSAGARSSIASADVRGKLVDIRGHTTVRAPFPVREASWRAMTAHALRGELQVELERVSLADTAVAWKRQAASPHRKLVIVP